MLKLGNRWMNAWVLPALLLAGAGAASALDNAELVLVRAGQNPVPIILPATASPALQDAADDLARHIAMITGATPAIHLGVPEPQPDTAIWVGEQPLLRGLLPEYDLELRQPEEIVIAANDRHLALLGRDRFDGDRQLEFGTPNAVYTFLQQHLGVRWLWPGALGTDIQPRATLSLQPLYLRFHPPLRDRTFRYPRADSRMQAENRWWDQHQRGRGSLTSNAQHAFANWWELYHETHPEYFALQPDGTRGLGGLSPHSVKLCVSNPAVAEQWLDEAQRTLSANPSMTTIGASPNDGAGWCVCPACEAWDHPDAPRDDRGRPSLTERYVRFWNRLAQGLEQRFPERRILLDVMAYSRYMAPPVATALADNIAVSYVGNFPIGSQSDRVERKGHWLAWAEHAALLRYRPNLFWYDGGVWGLPSVALQRTIEDFRFLAEHRCVGIDVDSVMLHWSTQGPQLYLLAQLAYDPLQDGQALLADYYRRGFGPAAGAVERYFALWDAAHERVVDDPSFRSGSNQRYSILGLLQRVYTPELLAEAGQILDEAQAAAARDGAELQRQRVAFVRTGLRCTSLQLQIIKAMDELRRAGGKAALDRALELCAQRDQLFKDAPAHALDGKRIMSQITRRGMREHLGPPTAAMLDEPAAVQLEPAQWRLAFTDSFDRTELGPHWQVLQGAWAITDHALQLSGEGGVVEINQDFPGLHRLVLEITPLVPEGVMAQQPEALGRISDLSSYIQSSGGHRGGYFLQLGGAFNTRNAIRRLNAPVALERQHRITPGQRYRIVAEFDGRQVRLVANEQEILCYAEKRPLFGEEHNRLGIYLFTPARVHSVQVFTAAAVVVSGSAPSQPSDRILDDPDAE